MSTTPAAELHGILCSAADLCITQGLAHARADDPHAFVTLHRQFEDGKARRRMVIDYLGAGRVRVALELHGTHAGKAHAVEVFATIVQGPIDPVEAAAC